MIPPRLLAAASLLALTAHAAAQNCGNTSTGMVPLSDLGAGLYQGFEGGLYPGGQNELPAAHAAAGQDAAAAIQPLAPNGTPSPSGKVVLVSIGMSNTSQEFSAWVPISNADPLRSSSVVVVNGAQGGQDARRIANANANYWNVVDQRLAQAGVTPQQVQVAWLKQAIARPTEPFPASAQELQSLEVTICQILKQRYPNIQICYVSSRIYAGYATTTLNPEPFAYESGFSVKWLIQQQIDGDPALNFDPNNGPVRAPWLAWGPYTWADGLTRRSDGLQWLCSDFSPDGTHPSQAGRKKVAALLNGHLTSDSTAGPWYGGGGHAAVTVYGQGCPGVNGTVGITTNSTPFLGNPQFEYGVFNARANSSAALFWSLAPASIPIEGCTFLVDPTQIFRSDVLPTNANGVAEDQLSIPGQVPLGLSLFTQWLVIDPGAPGLQLIGGAAMTFGVEVRLGLPLP